MKILLVYLIIINIVAVLVTVHDKLAAKRRQRRVRERTLLLISALGGSPCMYITMLLIRHKTKKPKFMIGIPVIFFAELAILILVLHYGFGKI